MKMMNLLMIMVVLAMLTVTGAPVWASDTDAGIEASAGKLYVFKTFLKGDDVTIKSEDGVVTLTGTVADEPRRLLAEETMANLSGVKSVTNELEIKGESPAENSDLWVGAHVKMVLLFHKGVSGLSTDVSVTDGVVTLVGEADNKAQKQLTEEYAMDVEGVKAVKNEMTIAETEKTTSQTIGESIDDASITSQIKLSLLFHHSTRMLKTQVKTDNGEVTLSGMARNESEKQLVTKLVNDINGVVKVNNEMTIEESKAL
ncbi:BON domain-containing protein [bacterium]|nr:BON domain-containing protein [candidate division CSSED10-310 bacterium]